MYNKLCYLKPVSALTTEGQITMRLAIAWNGIEQCDVWANSCNINIINGQRWEV